MWVLQQQQVIVTVQGAVEATLEGEGIRKGDPPQPPDAQHYSSIDQSLVSRISLTLATKAAA